MPPPAPDARCLAGCLMLVLLSVSPSIQAPTRQKVSGITSSLQHKASIGEKVLVDCKGKTVYPESGIMYWLANGTFVEQLFPDGSVTEEATEEKGNDLSRKLIFSQLTVQHLRTTFDCLITDPSGVFRKTIKWVDSNAQKLPLLSCPKSVRGPRDISQHN